MAKKDEGHSTPVNYEQYIESEESLLEQIRSKEEELNTKVSAAEQEYSDAIDAARKEALETLGQYRQGVKSESDSLWQQTMETAENEVEKIRREGENKLGLDRERKIKNFSAVVDTVVRAVRNG
jgi:vacuolar-type H+-ATPase subunit H